jgi:hypothetical protein
MGGSDCRSAKNPDIGNSFYHDLTINGGSNSGDSVRPMSAFGCGPLSKRRPTGDSVALGHPGETAVEARFGDGKLLYCEVRSVEND